MGVHFLPGGSCALYRVLAETTSDIIVRTDCAGTIHESSVVLNEATHETLLWQIVDPRFCELVEQLHAAAVAGEPSDVWTEVLGRPAVLGYRGAEAWFELQIRSNCDERGTIDGALAVLRCIEARRSFEDRLFVATMTDPLTGLTNRKAFVTMLGHLAQSAEGGCLAVFDIDYFKALNTRYGHAGGDAVLILFADLLRTLTGPEAIISRIGGESFGVLMPGTSRAAATTMCRGIIGFLGDAAETASSGDVPITASGGLAEITGQLDASLRNAELALAIAKAKGRNRLEVSGVRESLSLR